MNETYEQLRDQATGPAGEAWKAADRETGRLYGLYRELQEDPRYTDEHKAEKAWERYEAVKGKIEAGKAKAKDLLEKQARSAERFSIPLPPDVSLTTSDPQELLAAQNEASRVVRKIDRLKAADKGPFATDRADVLRQEYERGLQTGGLQGGSICRGVLEAADELGMDKHEIVDGFRKDRHRESFDRAAQAERLTTLIGGKVPEPPFGKPGQRKRVPGQYGRGSGAVLVGRERGVSAGTRRRPPWK